MVLYVSKVKDANLSLKKTKQLRYSFPMSGGYFQHMKKEACNLMFTDQNVPCNYKIKAHS